MKPFIGPFEIKRNKRSYLVFAGIALLLIFLYNAGMIAFKVLDQIENKRTHHRLQTVYHGAPPIRKPTETDPAAAAASVLPIESPRIGPLPDSEEPPSRIDLRFESLLQINGDTAGWITIPDTNIDYPVVRGEDNDYYLNHSFDRKKNAAGSIFMDYRNDASEFGRNTILYGHHMRDGSMFKHLVKYLDGGFFQDHDRIVFDGLLLKGQWQVFSVYVTDTSFNYIQTDFATDEEYNRFLKAIVEKSVHRPANLTLTVRDKILTLSTCSYEFDDARLVVHAKLL